MSSDSEISDAEAKNNKETPSVKKQMDFVSVISDYPILFNKSQVPTVKTKKDQALEEAVEKLQKLHGQVYSKSKLLKKISRMKGEVKEKSDRTKTGNKKIVLKSWETIILDMMGADENPSINRVPVSMKIVLYKIFMVIKIFISDLGCCCSWHLKDIRDHKRFKTQGFKRRGFG